MCIWLYMYVYIYMYICMLVMLSYISETIIIIHVFLNWPMAQKGMAEWRPQSDQVWPRCGQGALSNGRWNTICVDFPLKAGVSENRDRIPQASDKVWQFPTTPRQHKNPDRSWWGITPLLDTKASNLHHSLPKNDDFKLERTRMDQSDVVPYPSLEPLRLAASPWLFSSHCWSICHGCDSRMNCRKNWGFGTVPGFPGKKHIQIDSTTGGFQSWKKTKPSSANTHTHIHIWWVHWRKPTDVFPSIVEEKDTFFIPWLFHILMLSVICPSTDEFWETFQCWIGEPSNIPLKIPSSRFKPSNFFENEKHKNFSNWVCLKMRPTWANHPPFSAHKC